MGTNSDDSVSYESCTEDRNGSSTPSQDASFTSSRSLNSTLRRSSTATEPRPTHSTPAVPRTVSCPPNVTNPVFIPFPQNTSAPNVATSTNSNLQTLGFLAPLYALVPAVGCAPLSNTSSAPVNVPQPTTNRNAMQNVVQTRSGQRDLQEEDIQCLDLGPLPEVKIDKFPFPAVAVPSAQKHQILLYNIKDSDQCYAFRCVRERNDKKVYACIGCFLAQKTYSVTVFVKNCRFANDPSTLAHRCVTRSFIEELSARTKRTVVTSASGRRVYKRQASSSAEALLKIIKKEDEDSE